MRIGPEGGSSKPTSTMWVGIMGQYDSTRSTNITDIKGAASYVRLASASAADVANATSAGVKVIDCICTDISGGYGPGVYDLGGVSAINATDWANYAYNWFNSLPAASQSDVVAIEVLNEPYGWWFWGGDAANPTAANQANANAYAALLKAVNAKFRQQPFQACKCRPLILASWDYQWGGEVWNPSNPKATKYVNSPVNNYIDGVTVHPYLGRGDRSLAAKGNQAQVTAAYNATGKPVYVTEVGWSTAWGQNTGDWLQWHEADQATNMTNFVTWAQGTGYVNAVIIFTMRDYTMGKGTQTDPTVWDWYGIERSDGSHKPSYDALAQFRSVPRRPRVVPAPSGRG
jgi:hypothetical protein